MIYKQNSKIAVCVILVFSLFKPLSSGIAQGFFPDATFSKPLPASSSGKIKFRQDWMYKFSEGKMSPLGIKTGFDRYDSTGLKIEEANYDLRGNPLLELTYSYDEWGRETQCIGIKENKNFYRKWSYDFIDSSKTLIKKVYNNSSNYEKWIYSFDLAGNIVEEINYNSAGELVYQYKIIYTKFNKPAELIELNGNGTMYEKWIYLYDKKLQNIEVMQFNASEEVYKKYFNKFDDFGNQIEILTVDKDEKKLEKTIFVYQFFKQ